jgi:hypothetical protein
MYTFFMVWVEGTKPPEYHHRTMDKAQEEAERLARMPVNVGRNVFILTATSCARCEPQPVTFTEISGNIKPDEIPF